MAIQFIPAGAAIAAGARPLASRTVSTVTRMFKGSSGKAPPISTAPKGISNPSRTTLPAEVATFKAEPGQIVATRGAKVAAGAKAVAGSVASNVGMAGAFLAADALLSEDELVEDALLEGETVRSALPERTTLPAEPKHPNTPSARAYRELGALDKDGAENEFLAPSQAHQQALGRREEDSTEMIAYAAELVMQKMDAKPLLDQVEFLSRRYDLTRSEAFEVAAGANVYKFHPHVTEIVAAVSSFNTTGTLIIGAQRATRGV